LWRAAGARISGDWRVYVPRGLAREIVRRSAPREFTQHARNPARSVPIDNSFEQWSAEGGRDQLQRANRRWKGLLEAYERPPLDAAREEALFDYVARRKRSMPDELG
jgi:trimethylamine:corrinoid methyltransferase-like protein